MGYALPVFAVLIAVISVSLSPKAVTEGSFFRGLSDSGRQPGLLTLVFSQVTTWIFARSLMNAAILGFYYGIWGTLAYAAYYLSFLTGGRIIDSLRFEHGFDSIQAFLDARFGSWGTACYNFVVAIRLVSEVFANLLVIGILFGVAGSGIYSLTIIGFAVVTLLYSMLGGLQASMRTDVFQMVVFIVLLVLLAILTTGGGFASLQDLWFKPFVISEPGPILLLVALLQIWSYPMHDPVMMDRGFLADRQTTRRSFEHAAWISVLCILVFGSLGVIAGAHASAGQSMNTVLLALLGTVPMVIFNAALVVSAMSTLDSALSSAAKLLVVDMRWCKLSLKNGRLVMLGFMLSGLALVFLGNKDLSSAVAVSGTASMYLAPVVFFSLWGGRRDIPVWSYVSAFVIALGGAILYFIESSGYSHFLGDYHKYTKLLLISVFVLVTSCGLYWVGGRRSQVAALSGRS
ncbi:MAG TPA: sodium:proline symporter [Gammaproteobacteria bacterium]|nr:sodium:proline symporter [Gammaproteobacteria bacterium]